MAASTRHLGAPPRLLCATQPSCMLKAGPHEVRPSPNVGRSASTPSRPRFTQAGPRRPRLGRTFVRHRVHIPRVTAIPDAAHASARGLVRSLAPYHATPPSPLYIHGELSYRRLGRTPDWPLQRLGRAAARPASFEAAIGRGGSLLVGRSARRPRPR